MFKRLFRPTLKIKMEFIIMAKMTQADIDTITAQITTNTAAIVAAAANSQPDLDDTALKAAVDAQTAALAPVAG